MLNELDEEREKQILISPKKFSNTISLADEFFDVGLKSSIIGQWDIESIKDTLFLDMQMFESGEKWIKL